MTSSRRMPFRQELVRAALLVVAVGAGCASDRTNGSDETVSVDATTITLPAATSGTTSDATSSTTSSEGSGTTMSRPGNVDIGLQPYIDIAIADLAARLGLDEAAIATRSATITVWSDASLGCPKRGMQYAQVPTDGAVIELEADGRVYRYHSGGAQTPFLCEQRTA